MYMSINYMTMFIIKIFLYKIKVKNEDFIKLCREETIDNIRGYIGSYLEEK